DQQLMQNWAPNSVARTVREIRLHLNIVVKETNAAKWRCLPGVDMSAELAKCCQAIRHDALTTRFVDRRLRAVNDGDGKTRLPNCNRSRQSSGSSAGHQHVGFPDGFVHGLYQR